MHKQTDSLQENQIIPRLNKWNTNILIWCYKIKWNLRVNTHECVWTCACSIIRYISVLCFIYRCFLKEHMDLFHFANFKEFKSLV